MTDQTSSHTDDKAALGRQILAEMRALRQRAEQLGIPLSDPQEKAMAPDGGPTSKAHRYLKTKIRPLISVNFVEAHLQGAGVVWIAEEDFNEAKHKKVKVTRKPTRLVDPSPDFGEQPRDELLTMTVAALKELPEVEFLEEVPDKKSDLVAAILDARVPA